MIQPTAPTALPALSVLGDAPVQPAGETADGADFGALLALQSTASSPDGTEAEPLPGAATVSLTATPEPAKPGKILPHGLPETAVGPDPAKLPAAAIAALAMHPAKPTKPEPRADGESPPDPATAVPDMAPLPELSGLTAMPGTEIGQPANSEVPPVTTAPDDKTKTKPEHAHEHTGQGAVHRTIPTLPVSASAQAQAQMQRHAAQVPAAAELAAQPVPPAAAPAEQVRAEIALPRLALANAMARDEARPLAKLSELVAPETSSPLASPGAQQTPVSAQTNPPVTGPIGQVRPHDFAALIERIAVAREAAAPQAVSITVAHQDFGQVRLSFRPEDAGLSVAMSSADPGFARAAAAVPAPTMASSLSDQANPGQYQRGDSGAGQTGAQSHSRGGSGDHRRDGPPQPPAHLAPHVARDHSAPRSGIFA